MLIELPDGTFLLPRKDPELEAALDKEHDRIPGQLRWKPKGMTLKKISSAVKAIASGPASPEVLETRRRSCFGDGGEIPPCTALVKNERGSFCGACGCGKWKLAELDGKTLPKLGWGRVNCPLRKAGFSNAKA